MKMRLNMLMLVSIASFTVACTQPSFAAGEWVDLLENGLTDWQDSSGWKTGDEVLVNPANEKRLRISKPGKSIAVVETKSRAAYLLTKQMHGDIEAVIEFMVPKDSNSGIYFIVFSAGPGTIFSEFLVAIKLGVRGSDEFLSVRLSID